MNELASEIVPPNVEIEPIPWPFGATRILRLCLVPEAELALFGDIDYSSAMDVRLRCWGREEEQKIRYRRAVGMLSGASAAIYNARCDQIVSPRSPRWRRAKVRPGRIVVDRTSGWDLRLHNED